MVNNSFGPYFQALISLVWTRPDVVYPLQPPDGWKAQPGLAAEATAVLRERFSVCFFSVSTCILNQCL